VIKIYAVIIAGLLIYYLAKWLLPGVGQSVVTALPGRLKDAKIWGKEKAVRTDSPVAMHGVLDEGFKLDDGTIVLSDSKSRQRRTVYRSDIFQVSAYKMIVERSTRETVSDRGYIRVLTPDGNEYVPINLLGEDQIIAAYHRYGELKSGMSTGNRCESRALCRTCPYKRPCDEMGY